MTPARLLWIILVCAMVWLALGGPTLSAMITSALSAFVTGFYVALGVIAALKLAGGLNVKIGGSFQT